MFFPQWFNFPSDSGQLPFLAACFQRSQHFISSSTSTPVPHFPNSCSSLNTTFSQSCPCYQPCPPPVPGSRTDPSLPCAAHFQSSLAETCCNRINIWLPSSSPLLLSHLVESSSLYAETLQGCWSHFVLAWTSWNFADGNNLFSFFFSLSLF